MNNLENLPKVSGHGNFGHLRRGAHVDGLSEVAESEAVERLSPIPPTTDRVDVAKDA